MWGNATFLIHIIKIRIFFGCVCPHTADVGRGVVLGYGGLGIVIHGQAVIGDRTEIGSGVVIGGNAAERGVPIVGADVYIGAGAKILGPVQIGDGAVIGANAVIISDVASGTVMVGVPGRSPENSRVRRGGLAHHGDQT